MTELRDPPTTAPAPPDERRRVRRRREAPRQVRRRRALMAAGGSLILAGLVVLGYVAWQLWGTTWVAQGRQVEVTAAVEAGWGQGRATADTEWGEAEAILRISRFGEEYAVPVLHGSSDEVLAAGVGHLEDTAEVGTRGNYVLAAHRITHGEPFADFPQLRPGDLVEVETRDAVFTYELDTGGTELVVPFTTSWVLDPAPVNPDPSGASAPTDQGRRLITLVTCSELFHSEDRSVVFGHLVDRATKVAGIS